jgi:hypothetical protein
MFLSRDIFGLYVNVSSSRTKVYLALSIGAPVFYKLFSCYIFNFKFKISLFINDLLPMIEFPYCYRDGSIENL